MKIGDLVKSTLEVIGITSEDVYGYKVKDKEIYKTEDGIFYKKSKTGKYSKVKEPNEFELEDDLLKLDICGCEGRKEKLNLLGRPSIDRLTEDIISSIVTLPNYKLGQVIKINDANIINKIYSEVYNTRKITISPGCSSCGKRILAMNNKLKKLINDINEK